MTDVTASALADALRDRYRLERELGRGGMASVYLAHDLKHDRPVALKVMHAELAAAVGPERFLREIRTTARLDHPHLLPVLDSGEAAGQLWYTMPFVRGGTLRDRLRREGQLPIEFAVDLVRQVASALDYAHRQGVIHRDLKPENVLLADGQARVADFGVAKALASSDGILTETGLAVGTPAYISPEQATGGPVDARTDIYALACMLYELLAGEPPFTGPTAQAVISKHLVAPLPSLRLLRDSVSPALEAAVMKALNRNPADRFRSVAELSAALEEAVARPHAPTPPALPAQRLHRWGLTTLSVVALLAIALALAFSRRKHSLPRIEAKVVAVAPFRISGADQSLIYLREGLMDLLAGNLGGTAGTRSADPRAFLAAWRSAAGSTEVDLPEPEALRVAARAGAGQLLLGDVVGTAHRLVVHVTLLDVTTRTKAADVTVMGQADSLPDLIDRLAAKVLLLQAGEEQQRVAGLATSSLPALRAYLEGQSLYRRGQFAAASQKYEESVRLDSTFAAAGLMLLQATQWYGSVEQRDLGYRIADRYRNRLGLRDRALLDASSGSSPQRYSAAEQLRAAERYAEIAPDSPEAWARLAEGLFHLGPTLGLEGAQRRATAAFERARQLDSLFVPALEHLPYLYGQAGDTAALRAAINQLLTIDSKADDLDGLHWYAATKLGDSATVRALRAQFDRFNWSSIEELSFLAIEDNVGLPDMRRAIAAFRANAVIEADRQLVINLQQKLAWDSGRPDEARRLGEQLHYPFVTNRTVQAAIAWDGDSAAGAAAAVRLEEQINLRGSESAGPQAYARDLFTLAQYRLALGDASLARRAVSLLRGLRVPPDSAWLGNTAQIAVLLLDAQLGAIDRRGDAQALLARADSALRENTEPPHFIGLGNLIVAGLWEASGNPGRALSAVRRRPVLYIHRPFYATTLRVEGRLAEAVGDKTGAIDAYRRYLALRPNPEPAIEKEVGQVRAELARMTVEEATP